MRPTIRIFLILLMNITLASGSNTIVKRWESTGNPIITHKYTCDPAALVHKDTLFIFAGQDAAGGQKGYNIKNWICFATTDMKHFWEYEIPLKSKDFSWNTGDYAYAAQVAERNGKYYWYVSTNYTGIGVAVADRPEGPYKDALGRALLTNENSPGATHGWRTIDPTVFIDDDGQAWLYWGNGRCWFCKLNSDMVSIDQTYGIHEVAFEGKMDYHFTEAPWIHKYKNKYYLSFAIGFPERIGYAIASKPEGPYQYKGILNEIAGNSNTNHQSIIQFKGKWYFIYHNGGIQTDGGSYSRSICIDELEFDKNGAYKPVRMTSKGVETVGNAMDNTAMIKARLLSELRLDVSEMNKGGRCAYLHEHLNLPKATTSGATYRYKVTGKGIDKTGKVTLSNKRQKASLSVFLNQGSVGVDTTLHLNIAPDDNHTGYLFAHFCSNSFKGQQLRYALSSKEKPLSFKTMLDGRPVVSGDSIAATKCIRDPHILRGKDGYFYMAMTDMDCNLGWWSNHGIVLMKSRNLLNWKHAAIDFKTKYPEWEMNNAKAVWAPQTIWDPNYANSDGSKGRYMVYYSLFSSGINTIHFYYSYVNDDFSDLLGKPVELVKNGLGNEDHIDADIIWSETDSLYHLFYTHRGIKEKVSDSLTANNWLDVNDGKSYNGGFGEGSATYRLINSNTYMMLFDDQAGVYYYSKSDDNMYTFEPYAKLDKTNLNPRHGTVIPLSSDEMDLLSKWNTLDRLLSEVSLTKKGEPLQSAIEFAQSTLQTGWDKPIRLVSAQLDKAIQLLKKAKKVA